MGIFSLDVEGSRDFGKNLEGFGRVSWDLDGFLCIRKGFEGPLVNAGMGNLLEKVLQCHSLEITGYHVTG